MLDVTHMSGTSPMAPHLQSLPHLMKKSSLKPQKVNISTHDLMYDRDAFVYMSRITPESPDLTEDTVLPSSSVAQPSQEAPNFVLVLPDVPYVPYVRAYPPSLNPAPKFSKKRPLKAIRDDFPMDVAPYPDQYKTHPTDHLPVWPTNANDLWDPVIG